MFRHFFLFLSRRRQLRRWFETSHVSKRLTGRFIAGLELADAVSVCRKLSAERMLATLDHLGENVTTAAEASASRDAILEAFAALDAGGTPATVSIKLTQFGLDLSDEICRANVEALTARAKLAGSMVEIDMESSAYTSRTLDLVERLHSQDGCVRAVVQAYLYRTEEDVRRLNSLGIPVRLCKGAYDEPASLAFPAKADVDANYLKLARLLLDQGKHPAIATHDPAMIGGVLEHVRRHGLAPDRFEFQMLYGVRRDLQRRLAYDGWKVRLYVPYGDAWYPYFMRRLAERPANVLFIARNLLRA